MHLSIILNLPSSHACTFFTDQCEWSNKRAPQQPILNAQPNGDQCSNQFKKEEDSSEKYANPLRAQAQVLCINSAASSCKAVKAFPLTHRNHYYFRASQNPTSKVFVKNCEVTKTISPLVAGKENEGQTKSNWELGAIERRKNGLQMRKESEQEDERKQNNMDKVV